MASWSKHPPCVREAACTTLVHPWTKSCLMATVDLFFASCIGSSGFFFLMNLCQYLSSVMKKKKKITLKDFLKRTLQSTFFASSTAAGTISFSCFFRNLLGKYHYYTTILIPATIGGAAIFLESRKGREIAVNAFVNCILEFGIIKLQDSGILKWNSSLQTLIFMFLSSGLSFLLSKADKNQQYIWFFVPHKVTNGENENKDRVCFHKESCFKRNFNLFVMYSTTGLVLQCVRLFLSNIKNPKLFFSSVINPRTFKLAAFLGSYVLIYEAIRCFLYRKTKKYSIIHDAIAGFVAGAAFKFQPALPIFNSSIINIVQILTEIGCDEKIIPDIPYLEIVFMISCGLLFHTRVFHSDQCPSLMIYIMSAITHHRADWVTQNYKALTKNLSQ